MHAPKLYLLIRMGILQFSSHSRGAMVCQALLLWPIILKHANYIKISYPGNKTMFWFTASFPGGCFIFGKKCCPKIETWWEMLHKICRPFSFLNLNWCKNNGFQLAAQYPSAVFLEISTTPDLKFITQNVNSEAKLYLWSPSELPWMWKEREKQSYKEACVRASPI